MTDSLCSAACGRFSLVSAGCSLRGGTDQRQQKNSDVKNIGDMEQSCWHEHAVISVMVSSFLTKSVYKKCMKNVMM